MSIPHEKFDAGRCSPTALLLPAESLSPSEARPEYEREYKMRNSALILLMAVSLSGCNQAMMNRQIMTNYNNTYHEQQWLGLLGYRCVQMFYGSCIEWAPY